MANKRPGVGYIILAYLLTKNRNRVVVTTNFDHLTEDALHDFFYETPLVIGHESLAGYAKQNTTRPVILKIHHDLLLSPRNIPSDIDALPEAWEGALRAVFGEYHPVFLGYAGNDGSVMKFLNGNVTFFQIGTLKRSYWVTYKDEALNDQVQNFLDAVDGVHIRGKGFDHFMFLLGNSLGFVFPEKDRLLAPFIKNFDKAYSDYDAFVTKTADVAFSAAAPAEKAAAPQATPSPARSVPDGKSAESALTHYSRATASFERERYDKALKELEQAVLLEPDKAEYHYSLGVTLHELNRFEEALKEKQMAVQLELDPEHH